MDNTHCVWEVRFLPTHCILWEGMVVVVVEPQEEGVVSFLVPKEEEAG